MIKQKFRNLEFLPRDPLIALIACVISVFFSVSIANHLIPLFGQRRFIVQFTFLLLVTFFLSLTYYQVIKKIIAPRFISMNRTEKISWIFLPTLLALLLITSTSLSMPKTRQNNTLEIFAFSNDSESSLDVSILEIRDTQGKKVPIHKIALQGWEVKNAVLIAKTNGAALKYIFYGEPKANLAILFSVGPSASRILIRLNGHDEWIGFQKGTYSNNLQILQIPDNPYQEIWVMFLRSIDIVSLSFISIVLTSLHPTTLWLTKRKPTSERQVYMLLGILGVCYLSIYFLNNILPFIDTTYWEYRFLPTFPIFKPVGIDFRGGVYIPVKELFLSRHFNIYTNPNYYNIYPPLSNVIYAPYLIFNENTAYLIHIFILFAVNILCLSLVTSIFKKYLYYSELTGTFANIVLLEIFVCVSFSLLTGYPFLFSMERGNVDIFALAFSLASIWVLLKSPDRVWYQVLLLSIAVHLKIYPIFLFPLLFYKNQFKVIFPALVINIGFLFILGPGNAVGFINSIRDFSSNPQGWIGDHSASSFAEVIVQNHPQFADYLPLMRSLFTNLPLFIWGIAAIKLVLSKYSEKNIVLGLMVTVPLMEVFPVRSNDYKLVISYSLILLLTTLIVFRLLVYKQFTDYVQLFIVLLITLFIGRSYVFIQPSFFFIQDKYVWEILLQIIVLINIFEQLYLDQSTIDASPLQVKNATAGL